MADAATDSSSLPCCVPPPAAPALRRALAAWYAATPAHSSAMMSWRISLRRARGIGAHTLPQQVISRYPGAHTACLAPLLQAASCTQLPRPELSVDVCLCRAGGQVAGGALGQVGCHAAQHLVAGGHDGDAADVGVVIAVPAHIRGGEKTRCRPMLSPCVVCGRGSTWPTDLVASTFAGLAAAPLTHLRPAPRSSPGPSSRL